MEFHIFDISWHSVIFSLASCGYFFVIYYLYKYRNKSFLSTDLIPKLYPLSELKIHGDISSKYTYVKTKLYIENFSLFDITNNKFIMNAILEFRFNRYTVRLDDVDRFAFQKATSMQKKLIDTVVDGDDLIAQYHVQVTFSSAINHDLFPMNDHTITLVMINPYLTIQELIYEKHDDSIITAKDLTIEDWTIHSTSIESGYHKIILDKNNCSKNHAALIFTIKVKKSGLRKVSFLIMPLLIILFICSTSMLPFIGSENNVSLTIGCLTGILAYRYVISQNSPKVGYYTLIEYVYNFVLLLIVITFIWVIVRSLDSQSTHSYVWGYFWLSLTSTTSIIFNTYVLYFFNQKKSHKELVEQLPKNFKKIKFLEKMNFNVLRNFINNMQKGNRLKFIYHKIYMPNKSMIFLYALNYYCNNLKHNILPKKLDKDTNIIIFANLTAKTDYLYSHIDKLISIGIIDKNLKLQSQDTYIVFIENKTQDIFELIDLLLIQFVLYIKNPGQVLGVPNQRLLSNILDNFSNLMNLKAFQKYPQTFLRLINYFFDNMQKTIYFDSICDERIFCTVESPDQLFARQLLSDFKDNIKISCFYPLNRDYFQAESNITQSITAQGIIVWNIQSEYMPFGINFAIVRLNINQQSYLDWYTKKSDQYEKDTYFLIEGSKKNKKTICDKREIITLYSSMDVSRTTAPLSRHILKGIYTNFIHANAQGINDKSLRIIVLNDKYSPIIAKHNIQIFLEKKANPVIFSPVGTPTLSAYANIIKDKKILVLFPISGSNLYRNDHYENIIFFRPSMALEAQKLLEHAINVKNTQRLAIFCQDDEFGLGALSSIQHMLKSSSIEYLVSYYSRHNPIIEKSSTEIRNFNPDSIFFFSTPYNAIQLVHKLGLEMIAEVNLFAISYSSIRFYDFLKEIGLSLINTRLVPSLDSDLLIVREYLDVCKRVGLQNQSGITLSTLEGYINASIISDILKSTDGSFDHRLILEKISTYKNVDFKGLKLNFNPKTREIFNNVWVQDNSLDGS